MDLGDEYEGGDDYGDFGEYEEQEQPDQQTDLQSLKTAGFGRGTGRGRNVVKSINFGGASAGIQGQPGFKGFEQPSKISKQRGFGGFGGIKGAPEITEEAISAKSSIVDAPSGSGRGFGGRGIGNLSGGFGGRSISGGFGGRGIGGIQAPPREAAEAAVLPGMSTASVTKKTGGFGGVAAKHADAPKASSAAPKLSATSVGGFGGLAMRGVTPSDGGMKSIGPSDGGTKNIASASSHFNDNITQELTKINNNITHELTRIDKTLKEGFVTLNKTLNDKAHKQDLLKELLYVFNHTFDGKFVLLGVNSYPNSGTLTKKGLVRFIESKMPDEDFSALVVDMRDLDKADFDPANIVYDTDNTGGTGAVHSEDVKNEGTEDSGVESHKHEEDPVNEPYSAENPDNAKNPDSAENPDSVENPDNAEGEKAPEAEGEEHKKDEEKRATSATSAQEQKIITNVTAPLLSSHNTPTKPRNKSKK